jgi:hypothetical protein
MCERHNVKKNQHWFMLCQTRPKYFAAWEKGIGPGQRKATDPPIVVNRKSPGLGDVVSKALGVVGVTEERVSKWLGRKCNCAERREMLNRLGDWAKTVVLGSPKKETAAEELESIIGSDKGC